MHVPEQNHCTLQTNQGGNGLKAQHLYVHYGNVQKSPSPVPLLLLACMEDEML